MADSDGALHPTFRRYTFTHRISWQKLKIYYSQKRNQHALFYFAVGVVILPFTYNHFITASRSPVNFGIVALLALVTAYGLRTGVENIWQFWQTTEMNNPPPPTRTEDITRMDDVRYGHNPAAVVDRQVALNASVMYNDRTTVPQRVYACAGIGSWSGQFFQLDPPGHEISILYLDVILKKAKVTGKGVVQSLIVTDIHELSHWALDVEENVQVPTKHRRKWNEVIGQEVDYVRNDQNQRTLIEENESMTKSKRPMQSTEKCTNIIHKAPSIEENELPIIATISSEKMIKANVLQQPDGTDDIATIKIESSAPQNLKERLWFVFRILIVAVLLIIVNIQMGEGNIMAGIISGLVVAVADPLLGISSVIRELRE